MMAAKRSTWNMPRLLMVNEPPVNSCGVSLFARAFAASSRTCTQETGFSHCCRAHLEHPTALLHSARSKRCLRQHW